jgi:hypothetical protein
MEEFLDRLAFAFSAMFFIVFVSVMAWGMYMCIRENTWFSLFPVGLVTLYWTKHRLEKIENRDKETKQ